MSRYVSFSLFGNSRLYNEGALKNVDLCAKHYPGWEPIFYVAEDAPALKSLQKVARVEVMPASPGLVRSDDPADIRWHKDIAAKNMVWRYLILDDIECEKICFRDTDSYLSPRDFEAVRRWEDSGTLGCSIYECKEHYNGAIMPGLSSIIGNIWTDVNLHINTYEQFYTEINEPWIFYDIHLYRELFVNKISFSYMRFGYATDNPLLTPMPEGYGRFCGDVVNPERRNEVYE